KGPFARWGSIPALSANPKVITGLLPHSRFAESRLKDLSPQTWPLFDMRPSQKVVRDSAIQSPSPRPLAFLVYLLLPFSRCLAFLISDMIAALTAVCGESTGGSSNTVK